MSKPNKTFLITAAVIAAMCLASSGPAHAQAVGTASAVNPASTGTPPGGTTRTIELGTDVVFKERIQTTGSGAVQVLFVDRTALTVGANSDIVIDEFVYDPNAGTGTFVATLARGSLRFVGGQISRNSGATINTATGTIGIRGSVVGVIDFGGGLEVKNWQGSVQVSLPDGQRFTLPQGTQIVINVDPATGVQTAETLPVDSAVTGSDTDNDGDTGDGVDDTGESTGETPAGGGGGTGDTASAEPPAPPVFVPDPVTDVYFQDPEPLSPPEPDPDPPPPPPDPP